jgi:hypothetical protein
LGFDFLKKISALLKYFKRKEEEKKIRVRIVEPVEKREIQKPSTQITVTRVLLRQRTFRIRKKPPPKIPSNRRVGLKALSHHEKRLWPNKDPIEED